MAQAVLGYEAYLLLLAALACAVKALQGAPEAFRDIKELMNANAANNSQSQSQSKAKTKCKAKSKKKTLDPKDCLKLLLELLELIGQPRPPGVRSGTKGIFQRFCEQLYGGFAPGTAEWNNHNQAITSQQNGVNKTMRKLTKGKCPIPRALEDLVREALQPLPTRQLQNSVPNFGQLCYERAKLLFNKLNQILKGP